MFLNITPKPKPNIILHKFSSPAWRQSGKSFKLFLIAMVIGYADIVLNAFGLLGSSYRGLVGIVFLLSGPCILYVSFFLAIKEGYLKNLKPFYTTWLISLAVVLLLLFVYGTIVKENEIRFVGNDILMFSYLFAGILVGSKKSNWILLDKFLVFQFFITGLFAVFSWYYYGLGDVAATRSMVTWTVPYYFYGLLFAWPYLLFTVNHGSAFRKFTIIFGVLVYFTLAVLFQKRAPFLGLLIFVVVVVYVSYRQGISKSLKVFFKKILLMLLLLIGVLYFVFAIAGRNIVSESYEQLNDRFVKEGSVLDTAMSDTRLSSDLHITFGDFSTIELLIGRGLGGSVFAEEWSKTGTAGQVHNGMATIALKGGIILLIIWYIAWFKLIVEFIISRNYELTRFYIPIVIVVVISFVGGFLSRGIGFGFISLCAGLCMSQMKMRKY